MSSNQEKELLKKLRGHLAYKKSVEPYMIFRDVELEALLENRPTTIEQLSSIKGFPPDGKRVANWGQAIIEIFNNANRVVDFDLEETPDGEITAIPVLKKMTLFTS